MSLRNVACVALAMAMLVSSAIAQEEGRRQRGGGGGPGGGPGGFGGGFGGGMMMGRGSGGASSILGMLRMEEVRKEVGVSEDVYKSVNESTQEAAGKLRSRDLSEDDRKKLTDEMNTKAQEIMEEILTPEKQQRLKGLYVQLNGSRTALNTVIAKAIGLDDSARTALEKDFQAQSEKAGEKMREMFAGGGGERPDGAKIQEAMSKMQEENNKFIEGKLSDDQKKALEALKGEKFKFPEQRGFGAGPGGGAGGRGGRGGDQGRPRGDGN